MILRNGTMPTCVSANYIQQASCIHGRPANKLILYYVHNYQLLSIRHDHYAEQNYDAETNTLTIS